MAHASGKLRFFGAHVHLAGTPAFAKVLAPLRGKRWFVYAKEPFAGRRQSSPTIALHAPRRHLQQPAHQGRCIGRHVPREELPCRRAEVGELLFRGHPDVVDADLADYFGSIPHAELMQSVARRIVDRRVLHLIKMWLECAVEETDDRGRKSQLKPGTTGAAFRRVLRSHPCWRISTCAGLCWDGRSSGWSEALARGS
jgi:hypothetical protein